MRRRRLSTKLRQVLESHQDSNVYVKQSYLLGLQDKGNGGLTCAVKAVPKFIILEHTINSVPSLYIRVVKENCFTL